MWRELVRKLTADVEPIGDMHPGPDFFPGATEEEIAEAEHQVGVRFPNDLRSILMESNGIHVVFGTHLIWSTREIVKYNHFLRHDMHTIENFMPLDSLLFFADPGVDGIRFGMAIIQNQVREHVYAWTPYGDGRNWKASSVQQYIEWWLTGKITL